ncbi:MAG: hypothetical protein ACREET_05090 [Stellaceae bacterium]
MPAELIDRIEAWRASQPVPPPKVRAIVYLIEQGLAAVAKDRELAAQPHLHRISTTAT